MTFDKDWEKFIGGPNKPNRERIHVTLNRHSVIYLNGNAHRMMGKPEAVQLYFNRKTDKLGLKPANARLSDAFPIKTHGAFYIVRASPACRSFGIRLNTTEKFIDPDLDANGNLILDLSRTTTVTKRR